MNLDAIREIIGTKIITHWRGGSREVYKDINKITFVTRSNKWLFMDENKVVWEAWNIRTGTVGNRCVDLKPSRWYGLKIQNSEQMLNDKLKPYRYIK